MPGSLSEESVVALVARWASRDRIDLTDRLAHDLGIDGDDAWELFEAFGAEFEVNLEPLYRRWDEHFGPEGIPLRIGLTGVAIASGAGVAAAALGWPGWLAIVAAFACVLGWMFGLRAWPLGGPDLRPVTVGDLIYAASRGRWPEPEVTERR